MYDPTIDENERPRLISLWKSVPGCAGLFMFASAGYELSASSNDLISAFSSIPVDPDKSDEQSDATEPAKSVPIGILRSSRSPPADR